MIILIDGFCVLVEAISLLIFYKAIFKDAKIPLCRLVMVYLWWSVVAFVIARTIDSVALLSTTMLGLTFVAALFYNGRTWVKLFAAIMYHTVSFLLESVAVFGTVAWGDITLSDIYINEKIYFMVVIMAKFGVFALSLIVFYVYRLKNPTISRRPALLLTVLPLSTLVIILQIGMTASEIDKLTAVVCYMLLIASNIVTFYLFERQTRFEESKFRSKYLEEQVALQIEHYKELSRENRETRQLRHNIQNMFISIDGLLSRGRFEQARQIIAVQTEELTGKGIVLDTGNPQIDAVINAKQRKIDYKIDTKIQAMELDSDIEFDAAIIAALALDNAIEANEKEQSPQLGVVIIKSGDGIIMQIENTFTGKLNIDKNGLFSIKTDKKLHGFGYTTIDGIVVKYGGNVSFAHVNNVFSLNVYVQGCKSCGKSC